MVLRVPKCPLCSARPTTIEEFSLHVQSHGQSNIVDSRMAILAYNEIQPIGFVIIDVRDLIDGNGNNIDHIAKKLEAGVWLYRNGYNMGYRCHAGVSRSVTLAGATLAIAKDISIGAAVAIVQSQVPRANPNIGFVPEVEMAMKLVK